MDNKNENNNQKEEKQSKSNNAQYFSSPEWLSLTKELKSNLFLLKNEIASNGDYYSTASFLALNIVCVSPNSGQMSYPNGIMKKKEDRPLMHPHLNLLAALVEEVGLNFKVVTLLRNPLPILVSTTVHRNFDTFMNQAKTLMLNEAVLLAQMDQLESKNVFCIEFDDIVELSSLDLKSSTITSDIDQFKKFLNIDVQHSKNQQTSPNQNQNKHRQLLSSHITKEERHRQLRRLHRQLEVWKLSTGEQFNITETRALIDTFDQYHQTFKARICQNQHQTRQTEDSASRLKNMRVSRVLSDDLKKNCVWQQWTRKYKCETSSSSSLSSPVASLVSSSLSSSSKQTRESPPRPSEPHHALKGDKDDEYDSHLGHKTRSFSFTSDNPSQLHVHHHHHTSSSLSNNQISERSHDPHQLHSQLHSQSSSSQSSHSIDPNEGTSSKIIDRTQLENVLYRIQNHPIEPSNSINNIPQEVSLPLSPSSSSSSEMLQEVLPSRKFRTSRNEKRASSSSSSYLKSHDRDKGNGVNGLDIVISHFHHDLSWIDRVIYQLLENNDVQQGQIRLFIYHKGGYDPSNNDNGNDPKVYFNITYEPTYFFKLPNVGREGHTYIYHMLQLYQHFNQYHSSTSTSTTTRMYDMPTTTTPPPPLHTDTSNSIFPAEYRPQGDVRDEMATASNINKKSTLNRKQKSHVRGYVFDNEMNNNQGDDNNEHNEGGEGGNNVLYDRLRNHHDTQQTELEPESDYRKHEYQEQRLKKLLLQEKIQLEHKAQYEKENSQRLYQQQQQQKHEEFLLAKFYKQFHQEYQPISDSEESVLSMKNQNNHKNNDDIIQHGSGGGNIYYEERRRRLKESLSMKHEYNEHNGGEESSSSSSSSSRRLQRYGWEDDVMPWNRMLLFLKDSSPKESFKPAINHVRKMIEGVESSGIAGMNGAPPGVALKNTAMGRSWLTFVTKQEYLPDWRQSNNSLILAHPRGILKWTRAHLQSSLVLQHMENAKRICYKGIFAIRALSVLQYPQAMWQRAFEQLLEGDNVEAGHYLERMWCPLFENAPTPQSLNISTF